MTTVSRVHVTKGEAMAVETSRYTPAEELKKGRSVDAVVGEIVRRAQSSRLPTSRLPRGFDRNGGSLSWTRSAARKSLGR
ncbi:MAG: hypothetical protein H0V05_18530 [Euzebyaceae bacterium]|nr:hypothetical protein [Euzebyaceae bacterium]